VERVYLDHNATTPLDGRVFEAMLPFLTGSFGNPSSLHWFGQRARAAVDEAREKVAALVGASPSEVVFTGSGTEADNTALWGVLGLAGPGRRGLVVSTVEHHAVHNTARALAEEGVTVTTVRAGGDGRVDVEDLRAKVDERTSLVAVMLANNETGVLQPLPEAVARAREAGALVFSDVVQAAGKVEVDVHALDLDLAALSAHKIYGPQGVGALFVRRGLRLRPFLRGGSQERNRRAGTENVAGIVGFGEAARLAQASLEDEGPRLAALRDHLERRLRDEAGARRNGDEPRVPNTCNASFEGIEAESLLMALDLAGVAVSTGAACAAGAVQPSHVLRGMGLPAERVQGSVRFSLGRSTTRAQVDAAVDAVVEAVEKLRALRPGPRARRA
jgi:cysteine desulfurase